MNTTRMRPHVVMVMLSLVVWGVRMWRCRAADPSEHDVRNPNPIHVKCVTPYVHGRISRTADSIPCQPRLESCDCKKFNVTDHQAHPVQRHSITLILQDDESLPSTTLSKMSVLLETSAGDIVIDLLVDYAPRLCEK